MSSERNSLYTNPDQQQRPDLSRLALSYRQSFQPPMDGGEEAKKAAQGIIDAETIVRFTPPSIETLRARQSAISVGSIRIIPLTGQEASLSNTWAIIPNALGSLNRFQ